MTRSVSTIRVCLFDMGNVLLYFSHELMCRQIGELCGRSAEEIRRVLFDSGMEIRYERGEWNEAEFHRRFQEAVDVEIDFADFRRAGSDIFQLNTPMPDVLDALKQRGIRLVLLSNISVSHYEWIREQYDVLDRFDDLVLSFEAGAVKPEPAIFEAALKKIGCRPAECFYTDDIPEYVEIGRSYGLQAETFIGVEELRQHFETRGVL